MKRNENEHIRKFFAWILCLVMLVSVALPALATGEEDAPAKEETPVEEKAPAEEEAPAEEKAPVKEETPVEEKAPVKEETPVEEKAPAKEETPVEEKAPAKEETPVEEKAPAEEEAPAEEKAPAKEETPVEEKAPVKEETPAEERNEPSAEPSDDPAEEPEAEPSAAPTSSPSPRPAEVPSATLFTTAPAAEDEEDEDDNGFSFDWSQEDVQDSGWDSKVGVVKTSRGYYLYFDTAQWGEGFLNVQTADHPNSWDPAMSFISTSYDSGRLLNGADGRAPWSDEGIELSYYTSGGRRYTEAFIPAELLPDEALTFACNNASFPFDGPKTRAADDEEDPQPTPEPIYAGITIDGDFDDWAAVPRYDIDDGRGYNTVDQVAMVWDGEWVYILLVSEGDRDWQGELTGMGNWSSVTGAGTHGNGQYAITTDLGRTMLIQPVVDGYNEPAVSGVDGAKAAVNNKKWEAAPHLWELAIPASELPEYLETISFGFYMSEPTIADVSNMQDVGGGVDPFQADVVIDGKYNDWVGYPHTLIQYDRQGIQHHEVDGEAAIWSSDGMLYGHVVTEHPDHLAEGGSEFLAAISIAFNGDRSHKEHPTDGNFYPRILAINEDSSVIDYYTTVNEGNALPNGTHTFYIFDIRTDPIAQFSTYDELNTRIATPTAAELIEHAFGTMKVTVTGTKDEMEFDLDLRRVAEYIGADADDFKTIEAQFGRIGQQWVTTAGTPTGPILGVALAVGAVGAPLCYNEVRRRRTKKKEDEGEALEK